MITKKQLLQALSVLEDDAEIIAVFQGKYSIKYPSVVEGVNIIFTDNTLKASLMVKEVLEEEEKAAA